MKRSVELDFDLQLRNLIKLLRLHLLAVSKLVEGHVDEIPVGQINFQ